MHQNDPWMMGEEDGLVESESFLYFYSHSHTMSWCIED